MCLQPHGIGNANLALHECHCARGDTHKHRSGHAGRRAPQDNMLCLNGTDANYQCLCQPAMRVEVLHKALACATCIHIGKQCKCCATRRCAAHMAQRHAHLQPSSIACGLCRAASMPLQRMPSCMPCGTHATGRTSASAACRPPNSLPRHVLSGDGMQAVHRAAAAAGMPPHGAIGAALPAGPWKLFNALLFSSALHVPQVSTNSWRHANPGANTLRYPWRHDMQIGKR